MRLIFDLINCSNDVLISLDCNAHQTPTFLSKLAIHGPFFPPWIPFTLSIQISHSTRETRITNLLHILFSNIVGGEWWQHHNTKFSKLVIIRRLHYLIQKKKKATLLKQFFILNGECHYLDTGDISLATKLSIQLGHKHQATKPVPWFKFDPQALRPMPWPTRLLIVETCKPKTFRKLWGSISFISHTKPLVKLWSKLGDIAACFTIKAISSAWKASNASPNLQRPELTTSPVLSLITDQKKKSHPSFISDRKPPALTIGLQETFWWSPAPLFWWGSADFIFFFFFFLSATISLCKPSRSCPWMISLPNWTSCSRFLRWHPLPRPLKQLDRAFDKHQNILKIYHMFGRAPSHSKMALALTPLVEQLILVS